MWLTKNLIDDDIVLLHGDLLFDRKLIKFLLKAERNSVLVNKKMKLLKKDFKAVIKNGRIIKIGTDFFGSDVFPSFPLYKFFRKDFLFWLNSCKKYIEKGETNIYAEDVFNEISNKILLYPLYFDDELCMEIDTVEDVKKAEKTVTNTQS